MKVTSITAGLVCSALSVLFLAGCGEEPPVVEQAPSSFAFTATTDVVSAEERGKQDAGTSVEADFNRDGWKDLAVVTPSANGENVVSVYLRRPDPESPTRVTYYRGGTIERPLEGKIIGVASKRTREFVDLIVLVEREGGPNEMIHYHNDGSLFREEDVPDPFGEATGSEGADKGVSVRERVRKFTSRFRD